MKFFLIFVIIIPFLSVVRKLFYIKCLVLHSILFKNFISKKSLSTEEHWQRLTSVCNQFRNILPNIVKLFEDDYVTVQWFQKWNMIINYSLKSYEDQIKLQNKFNRIYIGTLTPEFLDLNTYVILSDVVNATEDLKEHFSNLFDANFDKLLFTMGSIQVTKSRNMSIELNEKCIEFFDDSNSNILIDWFQIPYEVHQISLQIDIINLKINSIKSKKWNNKTLTQTCNQMLLNNLKNMRRSYMRCIQLIKCFKNGFSELNNEMDKRLKPFAINKPKLNENSKKIEYQRSRKIPRQAEYVQLHSDYTKAQRRSRRFKTTNELISWYDIWVCICQVIDNLLQKGLRLLEEADKIKAALHKFKKVLPMHLFNDAIDEIKDWISEIWSVYGGESAIKLKNLFYANNILPDESQRGILKDTLNMIINMKCNAKTRKTSNFFTWALHELNKIADKIETADCIGINIICNLINERSGGLFGYIYVCMRVFQNIIDIYNRVLIP